MKRNLIATIVCLLISWPACLYAQQQADAGIKLIASMFEAVDAVVEAAESRWERDLANRLQNQRGQLVSPSDIRMPLDQAGRRLEELRQRWNEERESSPAWDPDQEEIAFELAEIHWNLVVEEAARYVAVLRREVGETETCSDYDSTAQRLIEHRLRLTDIVYKWIELAKVEKRDLAWEAWADFADGSLNVSNGKGIATQLDDFLKTARIIQFGETTRKRTECDMSSMFAELAITYPGDEYPPPEYPVHDWGPIPKIYNVIALEPKKVLSKDGRFELQLHLYLSSGQKSPQTHTDKFDMRILSVLGRNLANARGWIQLETDSPWVDYEIAAIRPNDGSDVGSNTQRNRIFDTLTDNTLREAGIDRDTQTYLGLLDRVGIVAYVRPGAMPGEYSFRLNGIEVRWAYGRSPDLPAAIGLLQPRRVLPNGDHAPVTSLFSSDHIVFELELDRDTNAESFDISLGSWNSDNDAIQAIAVDGATGIDLHATPDNPRLFRSKTFRLPHSARSQKKPLKPDETISVELGSHLLVSLPNSSPVVHTPLAIPVAGSPRLIGRDWKFYLDEAIRAAVDAGAKVPADRDTITPVHVLESRPNDIDISLGDHAAMMLLRTELETQLKTERNAMNSFLDTVLADPELAADWVEKDLGADVRARRRSVSTLEIDLKSLDADTLGEALGMLSRIPEVRAKQLAEIAAAAAAKIRSQMTASLRQLESVDPDNIRDLMGVLGSTASPWTSILPADLVKPHNAGGDLWWVPHTLAGNHVTSIDTKLQELPAVDKYADARQDVLMAVAGAVAPGAGLLRSLALRGRFLRWTWSARAGDSAARFFTATAVTMEALSALDVAQRKVPQYFEQRAEVRFARGLAGVVTHERFDAALASQKPGWMLLAEMAAGGIGLGAEFREVARTFRISASNVAPLGDTLVEDIANALSSVEKDGLDGFRSLSGEQKARLLAMDALIREQPSALQSLRLSARLRSRVQVAVTALADEIELKAAQRWWDSEWFKSAKEAQSKPREIDRDLLTLPPESVGFTLPFDSDLPVMRQLVLGEQLGEGSKSVVYAIEKKPLLVAKVSKIRPRDKWIEGIDEVAGELDNIERSMRFSDLLTDADIPHLQVVGKGRDGDIVYALQQRLPSDAVTLSVKDARMKRAMVDGGVVPPEFDITATLPRHYQHAILRLYKKLAKADIVWEDGHLENIYFFRNGLHWEAGILDLDRMFVFSEGSRNIGEPFKFLFEISRGARDSYVNSMKGVPVTPLAKLRDSDAFNLEIMERLVDADFSMQKMLEHKGYITYDADSGEWAGRFFDLRIVNQHFPGFRTHLGPRIHEIRAERGL